MLRRLEGKIAIVTGASQGIGEAVSRRFLAEGASVVMVARGSERGHALAAELGKQARFVAGSVVEHTTAEHALAAAQDLGGLDILVNNAGIDFVGDLLATTDADVAQVMDVNFVGALRMLVACAREMESRRGGSIVNVTSRLASIGVPGMALYAASKGALLALTRAAAVEFAPIGIRVNAVAPGLTRTPLMKAWLESQEAPDETRRNAELGIPQGRVAEPEEVAAAIAYLAADEAAHVTGVSIAVDGGYTAA